MIQHSNGLPTPYQDVIYKTRYARWLPEEGRREDWPETVNRYVEFMHSQSIEFEGIEWSREDYDAIVEAILHLEITPSMRALMTAGPALERDNVAGYNCAYLEISRVRAFDELMYVLMCGTGVGFSVENRCVSQLPIVAEEFYGTDTTIHVADSKIGWSKAFRELVGLLYVGQVPKWDASKVRPSGSPLKTFGGRASGPEPLLDLFRFTVETFKRAKGRRLTSLECHDICCKIAEIVVVGGVRRSAMISLSDLNDDLMQGAKSGNWWVDAPYRGLANNSAVYNERPCVDRFMAEMLQMYTSRSGERGIFNRQAAARSAAKNGRREVEGISFGTNPCSEIILRDRQFCNLTEVVIRPGDTLESLKRKVRLATILGTIQSTFTDFRYLTSKWKENCEEERLLGVSLTGIFDHPILSNYSWESTEWLHTLKEVAIETNREWSERLGINHSTAITCVKPSGTVSQLCDSASGIHPRYARYYIRRILADKKDPVGAFLIDQGVPYEDTETNWAFVFPMKAPETGVVRHDVGPMKHLEIWEMYNSEWCEHKPSATIYYTDDSFTSIVDWLWQRFDNVNGLSFFPHFEESSVYKHLPYEEIDLEKYEEIVVNMPTIDWTKLPDYETSDTTTSSKELACSAGACEI